MAPNRQWGGARQRTDNAARRNEKARSPVRGNPLSGQPSGRGTSGHGRDVRGFGEAQDQVMSLVLRAGLTASWRAEAHHPRLTVPISVKSWMVGLRPP